MEEIKYVKGIRLFNKNEKQPEFVIAKGVITLNELFSYAKENADLLTEYNGEKQLKIQIMRSKDGNPYISVDTWVPDSKKSEATEQPAQKSTPVDDGLPF